jgi:hypothetical protein
MVKEFSLIQFSFSRVAGRSIQSVQKTAYDKAFTPSAGNLRNRLDATAAHDFMYGLTFQLCGTLLGAAGVGLGGVRSYLDFVGAR